jgi:hypothetical protein
MRHRPSQLLVVALLQLQSAPPPFLNFDFLFPSESLTCYMHRISIRHVGLDCKCGESQLQLLQYIKLRCFSLRIKNKVQHYFHLSHQLRWCVNY